MPKTIKRYPSINIRSKNELAKRISNKNLNLKDSLILINDVLLNYDKYWHDNIKNSDPTKKKYVRSAYGTPLGKLLKLIDKKILAPNDPLIPNFIFGGISKRDHVKAAHHLLGHQKKRIKLGLDISLFFEQNKQDRVSYFFYAKCKCSKKASNLLAKLCCISSGPKNNPAKTKTLARGFATSTRLATWLNLDLFYRIDWLVKKTLKGHNPKISIFVDDIGITASRIDNKIMENLSKKIKHILENHDPSHSVPLNLSKKSIQRSVDGNVEHLGLRIGRKKISFGKKTNRKQADVIKKLKESPQGTSEKKSFIKKKKSYVNYNKYIKSINFSNSYKKLK